MRAGAKQIDGCTRRSAPGRQHADRGARRRVRAAGIRTGIDLFGLIDVAEDVVRRSWTASRVIDRMSLLMGYAGVYSSFLRHAFRAAERYGVSAPTCC